MLFFPRPGRSTAQPVVVYWPLERYHQPVAASHGEPHTLRHREPVPAGNQEPPAMRHHDPHPVVYTEPKPAR